MPCRTRCALAEDVVTSSRWHIAPSMLKSARLVDGDTETMSTIGPPNASGLLLLIMLMPRWVERRCQCRRSSPAIAGNAGIGNPVAACRQSSVRTGYQHREPPVGVRVGHCNRRGRKVPMRDLQQGSCPAPSHTPAIDRAILRLARPVSCSGTALVSQRSAARLRERDECRRESSGDTARVDNARTADTGWQT